MSTDSRALESLCEEQSTDEGFYFDYEETVEEATAYAQITNLDIDVRDGEAFEAALRELCAEWAEGDDFDFTIEGADEGDDEASDPVEVSFSEFSVYADDVDTVLAKIDKLCERFTARTDCRYSYEYEQGNDDGGTFLALSDFVVTTADEAGFLGALGALCENVSTDSGYTWEQNT